MLFRSEDELGQERPSDGTVPDIGGEWSGEDMEEDESGVGDEDDENGGYYYQPLNQDPDGLHAVPVDQPEDMGSHAEQMQEVQERIEVHNSNGCHSQHAAELLLHSSVVIS